jgi:hypothetical protein
LYHLLDAARPRKAGVFMKPIALYIYRDGDGISAIHTADGEFLPRAEMLYLLKEIERFYRQLSDGEIERYTEWAKTRKRDLRGRSRRGYVYLIKSYDDFYKIGQATNPKARVLSFQLPYKPKLIHTIPVSDMDWSERYLHRRFAGKRVDGEWFALDSQDVAYIRSLRSLEAADPL